MSHTAKILLLGSGELGREFVISAKRLGAYVVACDAYDDAPAMQLADAREVFSMLDGEKLREAAEKHRPDYIVPRSRRSAHPCWPNWRTRALPSSHRPARRN